MKPAISVLLFNALIWSAGLAQRSEPDIDHLINLVNGGKAEQVRADIPSLLSRHPNNPGVLYVQGLVTEEGTEAVRIYQSIVDNFPKSEWADDALYKVYQFYYSLGLYRTAELKLSQLRTEYPDSPYLSAAGSKETEGLPEEKDVPGSEATASPVDSAAPPVIVVPGSAVAPPEEYVLQVGAFTVRANAERQKQFFEELGYPVDVISKVKDTHSLFIVLVGRYGSYDEAKAKGADVKRDHGIESIVIAR
jgi:cell division septation protein DedD